MSMSLVLYCVITLVNSALSLAYENLYIYIAFTGEDTRATAIVVIKYLRLSEVIVIAGSCVLVCDSEYLDLVTINTK